MRFQTVITLTEVKSNKDFYEENALPAFKLEGSLYHYHNPDIAYSFISDATGRRGMALMFSYLNLSADIRYYMTVAMLAFSVNQVHSLIFQKMAVFKVRQNYKDPEIADVLREILSLNPTPISIDEETIERLISEDESMIKLIDPQFAIKKSYLFTESAIFDRAHFISNEDEKVAKLPKIKKASLLPAHEVVEEQDYFADYVRHFQQLQLVRIKELDQEKDVPEEER